MGAQLPNEALDGLDFNEDSGDFNGEIGDPSGFSDGSFDGAQQPRGTSLADTLRAAGIPESEVSRLAASYIPKSAVQKKEGALENRLRELEQNNAYLYQAIQSGQLPRQNGGAGTPPADPVSTKVDELYRGADLADPEMRARYEGTKALFKTVIDAVKEHTEPALNQIRQVQAVGAAESYWSQNMEPFMRDMYGDSIDRFLPNLKQSWYQKLQQGQQIDPSTLFMQEHPDEASNLLYKRAANKQRQRRQQNARQTMEGFEPMGGGFTGQPPAQIPDNRPMTLMEKISRAVRASGAFNG